MEIIFGKIKEYLKGATEFKFGADKYTYTGETVNVEIELKEFNSLSNNSIISVEFTKDILKPVLIVDKSLLEHINHISFLTDGNELKIIEKNHLNLQHDSHKPILKLPSQSLKNIELSGIGNFKTNDSILNKIKSKGVGNIDIFCFKGNSLICESVGDINIENIQSQIIDINHSGIGNIVVRDGSVEKTRISANKTGDLTLGFNTYEMSLEAYGVGSINLGSIERELFISGSPKGDIKFKGPVKNTLKIDISGIGDISGENINSELLNVDVNGTGNVSLSGKSNKSKIVSAGIGDIKLKNLFSQKAVVTSKGTGDTHIFVEHEANISLSGIGDIKLYGDKSSMLVNKKVTGIGKVKLINKKIEASHVIRKNNEIQEDFINKEEVIYEDDIKKNQKDSVANKLKI